MLLVLAICPPGNLYPGIVLLNADYSRKFPKKFPQYWVFACTVKPLQSAVEGIHEIRAQCHIVRFRRVYSYRY